MSHLSWSRAGAVDAYGIGPTVKRGEQWKIWTEPNQLPSVRPRPSWQPISYPPLQTSRLSAKAHGRAVSAFATALKSSRSASASISMTFTKIDLPLPTPRQLCPYRKCSQSGRPSMGILPSPNAHTVSHWRISAQPNGVPLSLQSCLPWKQCARRMYLLPQALVVGALMVRRHMPVGRATYWQLEQTHPNQRTHGWRERLAASSPEGEAAFTWGYKLLKDVVTDSIPRCLVHCDLINRNVLVNDDRIAAVFDWGCSLYGDHLYDLAWFEFWAPWTPQLDIHHLKAELLRRWQEVGYAPEDKESRLMACYLHIGLDHLAYNAYLGDWSTLLATAKRMQTLMTGV